jgi:hypothetical protein
MELGGQGEPRLEPPRRGGPPNPKSAAWDAIGAAYWKAGYRGGPTPADIETYLAGVQPGTPLAIVGASTRHLVAAAIDRGARVTVLDFSARMRQALRDDLEGRPCRILDQDVTLEIPDHVARGFQLVLADRLLNRFVEAELRAALRQLLRLTADGGQVRASVRLGLYRRDLPLIEEGRRRGTLHRFYDECTGVIDYGAAGDLLDGVLPAHGDIPRDVLLTFYRLRGPERRLAADDVQRFVAETTDGDRGLRVAEVRSFADSQEDSLYVLEPAHPQAPRR